jgi:flagellar biosynthesis/type III secretory pathway protein FliH
MNYLTNKNMHTYHDVKSGKIETVAKAKSRARIETFKRGFKLGFTRGYEKGYLAGEESNKI